MGSKNTIEIVIKATDNASSAIKKLTGSVSDSFNSMGKTVLKIGTGFAMGGILSIGAGLGVALSEAMEAEVNLAKLDAVLKSTGGAAGVTSKAAQDLAGSLSEVTRYSDDTILSVETMLLTFTNIKADIFPDVTEMALNMGEMFGSVDSAAIQLGKALNDPVGGISALTRVGVTFNDEQKRMIENLVASGDVAGAQAVIMAELEREFGGVAKAAGKTLAGKLTILRNKLLNVAEAVGTALIPFLSNAVDIIGKKLGPPVEALARGFSTLIPKIQTIAAVIRRFGLDSQQAAVMFRYLFGEDLGAKIENVLKVFNRFGNIIKEFVSKHAEGLKAALIAIGAVLAGAAIAVAIGAITTALVALAPVVAAVLAIGALGAAWSSDWMGIRTAVTDAWNTHIYPALKDIKEWLKTTIPRAIVIFKKAFATLKTAFKLGGLKAVGQAILDAIGSGLGDISNWFNEHAIQPLIGYLKNIDWSGIRGRLAELLDKLLSMATPIKAWFNEHAIQPLIGYLKNIDWSGIRGQLDLILDKLLSGGRAAGDWLTEKIWTPIVNGLKDETKIQGIFTNAGEIARKILDGILGGLGDMVSWVKENVIQKIVNGLIGGGEEGGGAKTGGQKTGESILEGIANAFLDIGNWIITNIIDPFMQGFTGNEEWSLKSGVVGQTILDAISSGLGDLWGWAKINLLYPLVEALLFADWGQVKDTALKILAGIGQGLLTLGTWVLDNLITPLINAALNADWSRILQTGANILLKLGEAFLTLNTWATDNLLIPLGNALMDGATVVYDKAKELGGQILSGIIDALSDLPGLILKAILGAIPAGIDLGVLGTITIGGSGPMIGGGKKPDTGPATSTTNLGGYFPMGFAGGGSVRALSPVVVGERGPELFVPRASGTIIPNHALASGGGGTALSAGGIGGTAISIQTLILQGIQNPEQLLNALEDVAKRKNQRLTVARSGL